MRQILAMAAVLALGAAIGCADREPWPPARAVPVGECELVLGVDPVTGEVEDLYGGRCPVADEAVVEKTIDRNDARIRLRLAAHDAVEVLGADEVARTLRSAAEQIEFEASHRLLPVAPGLDSAAGDQPESGSCPWCCQWHGGGVQGDSKECACADGCEFIAGDICHVAHGHPGPRRPVERGGEGA